MIVVFLIKGMQPVSTGLTSELLQLPILVLSENACGRWVLWALGSSSGSLMAKVEANRKAR